MSGRSTILYTPFSTLLAGAVLMLFALARPTYGQDPSVSASQGTLNYYINYGLENSPALLAAESDWRAERATAGYSGAPPELMVEWMEGYRHVETRVGPQDRRFVVKQSFPWFGTLGAAKQAAEYSAESLQYKYLDIQQALIVNITKAYWEGSLLETNIHLTEQTLSLLQYWESVVQTRYENGQSSYSDLIDTQIKVAQLRSDLQSLTLQRESRAQQLASLVGITDARPIVYRDTLSAQTEPVQVDSLLNRALTESPALQSANSQVSGASALRKQSSRMNMPSFTLGLDYIQVGDALNPDMDESGKDAVMFTFGLKIPIWFGANSARTREASMALSESRYAANQVEQDLRSEIETAVFEYRDAVRRVTLYTNELIPQAIRARDVSLSAYESGSTDINATLNTAERVLNYQLLQEISEKDTRVGFARIQALIGALSSNE